MALALHQALTSVAPQDTLAAHAKFVTRHHSLSSCQLPSTARARTLWCCFNSVRRCALKCCRCAGKQQWHKSALALHQALTALAPHQSSRESDRLHSNPQHQSLASRIPDATIQEDDKADAAGSGQVPHDEQGLLSDMVHATDAAAGEGFHFATGLLGTDSEKCVKAY